MGSFFQISDEVLEYYCAPLKMLIVAVNDFDDECVSMDAALLIEEIQEKIEKHSNPLRNFQT